MHTHTQMNTRIAGEIKFYDLHYCHSLDLDNNVLWLCKMLMWDGRSLAWLGERDIWDFPVHFFATSF